MFEIDEPAAAPPPPAKRGTRGGGAMAAIGRFVRRVLAFLFLGSLIFLGWRFHPTRHVIAIESRAGTCVTRVEVKFGTVRHYLPGLCGGEREQAYFWDYGDGRTVVEAETDGGPIPLGVCGFADGARPWTRVMLVVIAGRTDEKGEHLFAALPANPDTAGALPEGTALDERPILPCARPPGAAAAGARAATR